MIKVTFQDKGWTTIEGCLGCSNSKKQRSHADVSLNQSGDARITCKCGRVYDTQYAAKPRLGEPSIRFDSVNQVRFNRMNFLGGNDYVI